MAECELTATCIFFNEKMANMPSTAESLKKRFCRENNSTCARNLIARTLGREAVPADLFPFEMDRARAVISRK